MAIDFSARGVATLFFKNIWLYATILLTVLALAIAYLTVAPRIYQAKTNLLLRFGTDVRPELQQSATPSERIVTSDERREIIESNMQILLSRDLAAALLDEVGVERAFPEIVTDPPRYGSVADAAVLELMQSIVVKSGIQTNVIEISLFHRDRELAIAMLERLVSLYRQRQAELFENPQIAFVETQTKNALTRVVELQNKIRHLRQESEIYAFAEQLSLMLKQQDTIEANVSSLESRSSEAKSRQQSYLSVLGAVPTDLVSVADSAQYREVEQIRSEINAMRGRLRESENGDGAAELQSELAAKEKLYEQKLREIQARSQSGNNDLYQNVVGEYVRATADFESASAPVEYWRSEAQRAKRRIAEMETANQAILDATRDLTVAESTYIALRRKLEDATVIDRLNAENITPISLIEKPSALARPARPRRLLILLVAFMAANVMAAAIIVLKENLSERVYLPAHVEAVTRLRVFASFGSAAALRRGLRDAGKPLALKGAR